MNKRWQITMVGIFVLVLFLGISMMVIPSSDGMRNGSFLVHAEQYPTQTAALICSQNPTCYYSVCDPDNPGRLLYEPYCTAGSAREDQNGWCMYKAMMECKQGCNTEYNQCNEDIGVGPEQEVTATPSPEEQADCMRRECEQVRCFEEYSVRVQEGILDAEAQTCFINSPEIDTFVCGMIPDEDEDFECDLLQNRCSYAYRFYCDAGCEQSSGLCNPEITPEPTETVDCMQRQCQTRSCDGDLAVTIQTGMLSADHSTCMINSPEISSFDCGITGMDGIVYDCDTMRESCEIRVMEECAAGCEDGLCQLATVPTQTEVVNDWRLSITSIEFIQVVEGGNLVGNKPTAALVKLGWNAPEMDVWTDVSLSVDGSLVETIPYLVKAQYTADEKKTGHDTVIFRLPKWRLTPGSHSFSVTATVTDMGEELENTISENLTATEVISEVNFRSAPDVNLLMFSLHYSIDQNDIWEYVKKAKPFLEDTYPFSNVHILPTFLVQLEIQHKDPFGQMIGLGIQRQLYNATRSSDAPPADYSIGLFPDDYYGKDVYGLSYWISRRNVLVGIGDKNPNGYQTISHEIGHDWLGGKEEYNDERMGIFLPTNTKIYMGNSGILDDLSQTSHQYINFMGEAGNHVDSWVNLETWQRLVEYAQSGGMGNQIFQTDKMCMRVPDFTNHRTPGFLVAGTVSSNNEVVIDTLFWSEKLTRIEPAEGEPDFWFQTVDQNNMPGTTVPIYVNFGLSDPMPFYAIIPGQKDAVNRINLIRKGELIWHREPSASVPNLEVETPIEGENDELTFSWLGSDPDGETLTYAVLYSSDQGMTWTPLIGSTKEDSLTVNSSSLAGCDQCLVRVIASDGWNTVTDDAEGTFSIPKQVPMISVSSPIEDQVFQYGEPLTVSAVAYDMEEGLLDNNAILWTSDIDGELGYGDQLVVTLSAGVHTITAIATDTDGNQAVDAVTITIQSGTGFSEGTNIQEEAEQASSYQYANSGPDFSVLLIALLCVGGLVVVGIGIGIFFIVRNRKNKQMVLDEPSVTPLQSPGNWYLQMKTGPSAGQIFHLQQQIIMIGRASDNLIVIPQKMVSSHHAQLTQTANGYVLEDNHSTNGSFVNDQRIIGAHLLKPGDVVRFGREVTCEIQFN